MTAALNKILYVEDDPMVAEIAMMTLEDLGGYQVRHCASGPDALAALPDYAPQLVLMDVMMPGMDGQETMQNMRQLPAGENVPVIFMTAKAQVHQQAEYIEQGAIGVITKPFNPASLCEEINGLWAKCNDSAA